MRQSLAKIDEILDDESLRVDFFGREVLIVHSEGRYNAFIDVCPHAGGPLAYDAAQGCFRCQWHDALFKSQTGARLSGPAAYPLIRLPTIVDEGELVYVYGEDTPPDP